MKNSLLTESSITSWISINLHTITFNMKRNIKTIAELLRYELENLYCSEKKLVTHLNELKEQAASENIKTTIVNYSESSDPKRLKVDRVFSYLNCEPVSHKTEVLDALLSETREKLHSLENEQLRDLLVITSLQRINDYKISAYKAAMIYAIELGLETAEDLLKTILNWELGTEKELIRLALQEFNWRKNE